jgi:hypothetical protein
MKKKTLKAEEEEVEGSAYWKHRSTRQLRYGHGKYPSALRCARTTQWEYDPWHKRTTGPHLCCTWERSEASHGPLTRWASSGIPLSFRGPLFSSLARTRKHESLKQRTALSNTGGKKNQVLITTHCCFPHFLNWVREERDEDFTSGEAEQRQKTAGGTRAERSARKLPQTLHTRVVCPKSKLRTLGFQYLERQSRWQKETLCRGCSPGKKKTKKRVGNAHFHKQFQEFKAPFTLGVRANKTWGQLWAFFACCLAPRVANWPPKFDGILFLALGPIQGLKVQHLLVTLGRLKRFFSSSALTLPL